MAYDRTFSRVPSPAQAERLKQWAQRKPCVALMGEFSAGKSTLLNFLIEEDLLPTRATATELPPVWFSHGEGGSHWVDAEGDAHDLDPAEIASVPRSARYIRLYIPAEILEHCDVIDTPGISDPNLAVESWRFAAGAANMVLWCTSATQAWRQTERAAWTSLPERLQRHSLLIVTRADKLVGDGDRDKVDRRLARETAGLFNDRIFMATLDAVRAKSELTEGESSPLWEASGAADLLDRLAARFEAIYEERAALLKRHLAGERVTRGGFQEAEDEAPGTHGGLAAPADDFPRGAPEPERFEAEPARWRAPQHEEEASVEDDESQDTGVVPTRPTRVHAEGSRRSERPGAAEASTIMAWMSGATAVGTPESSDAADDEAEESPRPLRQPDTGLAEDQARDDDDVAQAMRATDALRTFVLQSAHGVATPEGPQETVADDQHVQGAPEEDRDEAIAYEPDTEAFAEDQDTFEHPEEPWDHAAGEEPAGETAGEDEATQEAAVEPQEDAPLHAEAGAPVDEDVEEPRVADEPPAEAAAEAEDSWDSMAEPVSEAEPELHAEPSRDAEPEFAEAEAPTLQPYMLDAAQQVGHTDEAGAEPPREVRLWREIVARTAVAPENRQIVGMIEELLSAIYADAKAEDAPAPASETAEDGAEPKPEATPAWRRLA